MQDTRDALIYVRQRIQAILAMPNGWGPWDTIDLQVILLIELGRTAVELDAEGVYTRWVRTALSPSDAKDFIGAPRTSMYARTHKSADRLTPGVYEKKFVDALRAFVEAELPGDLGMIVQAASQTEEPG